MSIGETLAQAREQAGLTIAQVSQRTRIRTPIIASIEDDDYGACGGDFYVRGHIRALGRAIGIDPEPLIREYDAQQAPPIEEAEPDTVPPAGWERAGWDRGGWDREGSDRAGPDRAGWGRRRSSRPDREESHLAWEAMRPDREFTQDDWYSEPTPEEPPQQESPRQEPGDVAPEAEAGWASEEGWSSEPEQSWSSEPEHNWRSEPGWPAQPEPSWRTPDAAPTGMRRPTVIIGVMMVLLVAAGLVGYHFIGGSARPAQAGAPAKRHTSANSGTSTPTPSTTPSSAAPAAAHPISPVRAIAFGVHGPSNGDHNDTARQAIDGRPGTAWQTDWYTSADFGHLYSGTGLLLDLGRPAAISSARIALGPVRGVGLELRVGNSPTLGAMRPVATARGAGGTVRLSPTTPVRARYALIWFTRLPRDPAGTFRAFIYNIRLSARS